LRVLRCSNNEYLEDINALAFEDIADSQAAFPIREVRPYNQTFIPNPIKKK
jgi:hypothetical protein